MALRTPVGPGVLTYSDMEMGNRDILLVSRLQWEILERLRLAGSGCQLSEMAKFNHFRGGETKHGRGGRLAKPRQMFGSKRFLTPFPSMPE